MNNLTIMDIAREAGVSKATVSRVINSSGAVSQKTKERVMEIINANKFSPSATARNLSMGTSSAIGFIVPEIDNPFFGEILRGVTEVTDKNNLTLMCYNTDDDREKDRRALNLVKENRVKGILYTPAADYSDERDRKRLIRTFTDVDGVYFNDYQGIYEATAALIEAGHTKIGMINADLERVLARDRQKGFFDAMKEAGIPVREDYMFAGDYHATKAYHLSRKLLAMEDRPTAVITCNNRTTLGFLKALSERGESVPDDIVCVGLDRIETLELLGHQYNFVERDAMRMGHEAIKLLLNRMEYPERPKMEVVLGTRLIRKKM